MGYYDHLSFFKLISLMIHHFISPSKVYVSFFRIVSNEPHLNLYYI